MSLSDETILVITIEGEYLLKAAEHLYLMAAELRLEAAKAEAEGRAAIYLTTASPRLVKQEEGRS